MGAGHPAPIHTFLFLQWSLVVSEVRLLKQSLPLREAYVALQKEVIETYRMELLTIEEDILFPVDHDVVFVGEDDFIIYATEDNRYYVRPVKNDPTQKNPNTNGICLFGWYFSNFQESLDAAIRWMQIDPNNIPTCTPPREY